MVRKLLCVKVSVDGYEFCLMTSRLESTREHSVEQTSQLKIVFFFFRKRKRLGFHYYSVCRRHKFKRLRSYQMWRFLPGNVFDALEFSRKPKHHNIHRIRKINNNLRTPAACKHCFERIFFRAEEGHFSPRSLDLISLGKLNCGRFPSEHAAMAGHSLTAIHRLTEMG